MSILVTGGLGVNGAPALRKLVERGSKVVVIDTRPDLSLLDQKTVDGISIVTGDCTDARLIKDTLQQHRCETIVHMASIVAESQKVPLEAFRINAYGTTQLLDIACTSNLKRFVFTSSRGVYGEQQGETAHPVYRPFHEDAPLHPARVYDVCKVAAEGMGRNYALIHGIQFIALRFATIFGPGKTLRHGNYSVLSRLIEDGLAGKPVRIASGGDQKDDLLYVEDAAEAIVTAALHPDPHYDAYNISSGIGQTLHDVADAVRAIQPKADIEIGPGLSYMGPAINHGILDNSRASKDLGFRPSFNVKAAIADYARRLKLGH